MKSIEQSTPSQYKVLIPWFESIGIVKERVFVSIEDEVQKRDELHVDLDVLKPKDFDELVRYFGLSWQFMCLFYKIIKTLLLSHLLSNLLVFILLD